MAKGKTRKGKSSSSGGGGGGGLLSMRSGMRKLVGVEKDAKKKKANPVWNVVSWVAVLALAAVAVVLLVRRFGS